MSKKYYEVIVSSGSSSQFSHFRVSPRVLTMAIAGVVVIVLMTGAMFARYVVVQRQKQAIAGAREATHSLRSRADYLKTETEQMEGKIGEFTDTVDEFKRIFGVKSETSGPNSNAGPGMALTETKESEQYNAFLYLAKLREEPGRQIAAPPSDAQEIEERGVLLTRTPCIRPVKRGFIMSGYGYRIDPFTGKSVRHQALDISAWYWEEVMAPADGLVVRTGFNAGSGHFVEISHGFGYTTRYEHLQKYTVVPGDRVRRYDTIGYVGNTGRSTGPHLHYEVAFAGQPLDPLQFVSH